MVAVISSVVIKQECTHDLFLTMSWGGVVWARASSAKTRGFHTQLDEGPETHFMMGLEVLSTQEINQG